MKMDVPGAVPQPRAKLVQARAQRKLSQQQVAERIGTTHVNVSRWERGITKPSPYFRRKLVQFYGRSEEELDLAETFDTTHATSTTSLTPSAPSTISTLAPEALYDPMIPLPPPVTLVGRELALAQLKQRLCSGQSVTLTALNGLPGVGKTALSIAVAHDPDIRSYFRDGILWAGLGLAPNTSDILSRWGGLLGLYGAEMGDLDDGETWAVALRRVIGARRMLLVIDDAWSLKAALAFKVGGPNCAHLITTRYPSIASQLGTDGAVTVSELSEQDGMALLRKLAPGVVDLEQRRAGELVKAVGGLPLALTLMGNYLRLHSYGGHPHRIALALDHLLDAQARLQLAETRAPADRHPSLPPDAQVTLSSVIAVTDQQLAPATRAAFHALAIFPPKPASFSDSAAMVVAGCDAEALYELLDTGLVESSGPDRFTLHQVIADYARAQLGGSIPAMLQQRLVEHMTNVVERHKKDYALLEQESSSVFAALEAAHTQSNGAALMRCIYAFIPYLRSRGLYNEAAQHLRRAYEAAASQGDDYGKAGALLYLGEIAQKQGNYEQASANLKQGLDLARRSGQSERITALLAGLGWVTWKRGEYAQAEVYLQEGLALAQQIADKEHISHILESLGSVAASRGAYNLSKQHMEEALSIARESGDKEQTCTLLINLGVTEGERGNHEQEENYYREGLILARQLGHREWIILLLSNLGDLVGEQGNYKLAEQYFEEGLKLARQINNREWESVLLNNLGHTTRKQGFYSQAGEYLKESLFIAQQINRPQLLSEVYDAYGNLYLDWDQPAIAESTFRKMLANIPVGSQELMALAHYGLGRAAAAQGRVKEAYKFGEMSLAYFDAMNHRSAKDVRQWLEFLAIRENDRRSHT